MALAITGLIVPAASGTVIQILQSTHTTAHMLALRQVQNAGFWMSRDSLQGQEVTVPGVNNGFPFTLEWIDWDDNDVHQVVYSLEDMTSGSLKEIQRQEKVNGSVVATTVVGKYIEFDADDSGVTSCAWDASTKVFTFTITVTVTEQSETREYKVWPRTS